MVFSKRNILLADVLPDVHQGCADALCWGGVVLFTAVGTDAVCRCLPKKGARSGDGNGVL